jgi:hypothetical protein
LDFIVDTGQRPTPVRIADSHPSLADFSFVFDFHHYQDANPLISLIHFKKNVREVGWASVEQIRHF